MIESTEKPLALESFGVRTASGWTSSQLTFELGAGETMALIGPAGSGKTLIFEQFLNVPRPGVEQVGKARIGRIAWVPQDARLAVLPTDRVWSLLGLSSFKLRLRLATGKELAQSKEENRAADLLKSLRLDPGRIAELPFRDLSATERRGVLLARALMTTPDLLLVDGWDEQMDGPSRRAIGALLRKKMDQGLAVLLSSRRYPLLDFEETRAVSLADFDGLEAPVPLLQKTPAATPHDHVLLEVNRLTVERRRLGMFKRRSPAFVLDGASLFVRHGESLAVLGVAGAGKTRFLKPFPASPRPRAEP